jgi:hypothetical protein
MALAIDRRRESRPNRFGSMALRCGLSSVDTGVSDNGLENLVGLHELEELGLDNTQVTDAALASLQKLTSLRRVILTGTRVTESGVTELKRSLPDVRVEW